MSHPSASTHASSASPLHAVFLSILPRIERHGRIYFRHLKCLHAQEDAIQEMVAISWKWCIRLAQRGKNPARFPSAIATFAARAVRSGRRLCGQEKSKDVLSPRAQQRRGFLLLKVPDYSTLESNPLFEALIDNTRTPPDEQACFRIDFPRWLGSLSDRNQRLAEDLMIGERTLDVASRHGCSPARISQLRREFHDDWQAFCGELPDEAAPPSQCGNGDETLAGRRA